MTKIIVYAGIAITLCGLVVAYVAKIKHDERAKVIAEQLAKSNQNIAERRIRDATFDKFDAAAMCRDGGFEWVFSDGKSYCR